MPDSNAGPEGQEPTGTEGQEPTNPTADQASSGTSGTDDQASSPGEQDGSVDALPEWAQKQIQSLRQEAAAHRTKVREYEQAQLTEQERMAQRVQELEAANAELTERARTTLARAEVVSAAQRLGVVDPDAAFRLIDSEALSYDDDGRPQNAEAVVRDLIKARPYLAPSGSGDAGARGPAGARPGMNDVIRRAAGRQ